MKRRKVIFIITGTAVVLIVASSVWFVLSQPSKQPTDSNNIGQKTNTTPTPPVQPQNLTTNSQQPPSSTTPTNQWPVQISMADAASLTVVVNKKHQLPNTYSPNSLVAFGSGRVRAETASALTRLFQDAQAQGINLKLISGYRSYTDQKVVYTNYVNRDGQVAADTYSARPGFSEHQTGLAADVGTGTCDLDVCFGNTPAGQWIATNAKNYGFIIRYPKGKEADTGYQYEPWHLRFLGAETANSVYESGKTLDQYYNVPAGSYE